MKKNTVGIQQSLMQQFKTQFSKLSFWHEIETPIALYCSEIDNPTDEEKTQQLIDQLQKIKKHLGSYKFIHLEDLEFLEDMIDMYRDTKNTFVFKEDDTTIPLKVIDQYAGYKPTQEGIFLINEKYNFTQLTKLTNGIYKRTGFVKFFISSNKRIKGKIIAELNEHEQEIPIATLIRHKKLNKNLGVKEKEIALFGQWNRKTFEKVRQDITGKFYLYRFITENNIDMTLLSQQRKKVGEYVVTGMVVLREDSKLVTETVKIPTKLPILFSQTVKSRILQFKNHEDFFNRIKSLGITDPKNNFVKYPFVMQSKKRKQQIQLNNPAWYERLIWAWLLHEKKGELSANYPLHLIILGPPQSGKSSLLNALYEKSKEVKRIFSGSGSTMKNLIPSFKYKPAKIGYLAESNRFAFCDEFFRCFNSSRYNGGDREKEIGVALMNDLLEHLDREAGSGISDVRIQMTARILATTNPIRGIKTMQDLLDKYDESFLSRFLIYNQTKEHVQIIRESNDDELKKYEFKITTNMWISIIDYLQSLTSKYDKNKMMEIYEPVKKILSNTTLNHYSTRHKHHLECILDGVIKTRCLIHGIKEFNATKKDYLVTKKVWGKIISSWISKDQIIKMRLDQRIYYLPDNCQIIHECLIKEKSYIKQIFLKVESYMTNSVFIDFLNVLQDFGLIKLNNEIIIRC